MARFSCTVMHLFGVFHFLNDFNLTMELLGVQSGKLCAIFLGLTNRKQPALKKFGRSFNVVYVLFSVKIRIIPLGFDLKPKKEKKVGGNFNVHINWMDLWPSYKKSCLFLHPNRWLYKAIGITIQVQFPKNGSFENEITRFIALKNSDYLKIIRVF